MDQFFIDKKAELIGALYRLVREHLPNQRRPEFDAYYGKFLSGIMSAKAYFPKTPDYQTAPKGIDLLITGCANFLIDEIQTVYSSVGINSVGEALLLSRAYFKSLNSSMVFFRGQSNIEWELRPTMGRYFYENKIPIEDPSNVTQLELDALSDFIRAWNSGDISPDPIDQGKANSIPGTSAAWWILMQHYRRKEDRTRLLDITSSIFSGFYFASQDFTDDKGIQKDGVLYLICDKNFQGRYQYSGASRNWDDLEAEELQSLFAVEHLDTPRLLITQHENERLKTQMGALLWWPKFNKPYRSPFAYLRVPASSKERIRNELASYGIDEGFIYRQRSMPAYISE